MIEAGRGMWASKSIDGAEECFRDGEISGERGEGASETIFDESAVKQYEKSIS